MDKKEQKIKKINSLGSLKFKQISLLDEGFGLGVLKTDLEALKSKVRERDKRLFEALKAESKGLQKKEILEKKVFEKQSIPLQKALKPLPLKQEVKSKPVLNKVFPQKKEANRQLKKTVVSKVKKTQIKKVKPNKALPSKVINKPSKSFVNSKLVAKRRHLPIGLIKHFLDLSVVTVLMALQFLFLKLFFREEDYFIIDLAWGHFFSNSFNWYSALELMAFLYICYGLYYFLFMAFVGKSLGAYLSERLQKTTQRKKTEKAL